MQARINPFMRNAVLGSRELLPGVDVIRHTIIRVDTMRL